jgi:glutamyl-tRNA reductase
MASLDRGPLNGRPGSFLARYHGLEVSELASALYVYRGDQVAHRLAAIAAGLHSLVLGEAQIQGGSQSNRARTHRRDRRERASSVV